MIAPVTLLAVGALLAASLFGQTSTSVTSSSAGFIGSSRFGPAPLFGMAPVTGAPYSGEEVNEMVQTLADGTHITRTNPAVKVYRDSQGRTRTERQMFMPPAGVSASTAAPPVMIEITDPVARAKYVLDTQNKIAHRQELAAPPTRTGARGGTFTQGVVSVGPGGGGGGFTTNMGGPLPGSAPPRPQVNTEKLAPQTIEGVLVEGTRSTMTFPIGAFGNDRPITTTNETWMSPDLKVMILSKNNDPRSGENTHKLTGLSRTEPDPGLFQPPPDYTVVDEKADFTISWGSQNAQPSR